MTPSVTAQEEYNDNVFLEQSNTTQDLKSTISPALLLSKTTERYTFLASGFLNQIFYAKTTGLNATDTSVQGSLRYAYTPRLSFGANGSFGSDSQPDRELETTGLVFGTTRRNSYSANISSSYLLSPLSSMSVSYGYGKSHFESGNATDTESHRANLSLGRTLTRFWPMAQASANLGYSRLLSENSIVQNYTATTGLSKAWTEKWSVSFDGGLSYSQSEFEVLRPGIPPVTEDKSHGSLGWTAHGSINYRGDLSQAALAFGHEVTTASGLAGAVERTSVSVSGSRRFSEKLTGSLAGSYYINTSGGTSLSLTQVDQSTLTISPVLRYELSRDMSLDASYTFSYTSNRQSDTNVVRNLLLVRFRVQHPLWE